MLIEKITGDERDMIESYRRMYAINEDATSDKPFCSFEHVLREWDKRKSEYLYRMLGDQLMVTKPLTYEKSRSELEDEICNFTEHRYGRVGRSGEEFYQAYYALMNEMGWGPQSIRSYLDSLICDDSLLSNRYEGESFDVPLDNGKSYRIANGCKTSKALGKIAQIYNLPGFEDFRICHSQILNQKTLTGHLTVSIHPLDYMTMSDNECGWESCMSWRQEGGYRQGTVEMMNSPCVVVAYLSSDTDMPIYTGGVSLSPRGYWNSKKWRCLFVVERNMIISVKDYPYCNNDLDKLVVEWLVEMAEKNLNWTFQKPVAYQYNSDSLYVKGLPEEKNNFHLEMLTNTMYNDFGSQNYHWVAVSPDICEDEIGRNEWRGRPIYTLEYSGYSECMVCGELGPDISDEGSLACYDCQDRHYCDCCGDPISGDIFRVDGIEMCGYCYENRTVECACCNEVHLDDTAQPIYIIPRYTAEEQKDFRKYHIENDLYNWCPFPGKTLEECEFIPSIRDPQVNLCPSDDGTDCFNLWVKHNCLKGHQPHLREVSRSVEEYYLYFDELTPQAQEEYCWGFDNSNEEFKNNFRLDRLVPSRVVEA